MATLAFEDTAALRLEALYSGHDIAAQRAEILRRLALQPGERVVDIGCGPGFLSAAMAEAVGHAGRVRGIDISADLIARARARNDRPWLSYDTGDATAMEEPDAAFDVAVAVQVAEYLDDVDAFAAELFRVLRPGGRALVVATDWDALVWHADDVARMDRVLDAFHPHCADSRLPRTLPARLRAAGLQAGPAAGFPIVNTALEEGAYSTLLIPIIADYITARGSLPAAELSAWTDDLAALDREGRYFFLTTRVIFPLFRPD